MYKRLTLIIAYYNKMINQRLLKSIEKSLLRNVLPYVTQGEVSKELTMIGRVNSIIFDGKNIKQKRPKCIVCGKPYENYLIFILHLEMIHAKEIKITKYQFAQDTMTIYSQRLQIDLIQIDAENQSFQTCMTFQNRLKIIFAAITSKFEKKKQKNTREFFHSIDIFRQVRLQSQDEDSEDELGHIEKQLEKMRISDFSDVNENDKQFFITWNNAIHEANKSQTFHQHSEFMQFLSNFAKECKKKGVKRITMVLHAWTIWSTGRITSREVIQFLRCYDNAMIE